MQNLILLWKEVVELDSEDECFIGVRDPAAIHDMPPAPSHLAETVAAVVEDYASCVSLHVTGITSISMFLSIESTGLK